MKLNKILHYWQISDEPNYHDLFEYNANNEISYRLGYSYPNDSLGWVLNDSTHYYYGNGELIQKETLYFSSKYLIRYCYEYENANLIKEYRYDNQQLLDYIEYDYNNNLCIKESLYTENGHLNHYIINHYDNVFKIKSDYFTEANKLIRVISYIYDFSGNLLIEESKKVSMTSSANLDYLIRYEYY